MFFFLPSTNTHQWCVVALLGDEVTPFDDAVVDVAGAVPPGW